MQKVLAKIASINFVSEKPRYRTHEEIGKILKNFAMRYPDQTCFKTIGYSLEGRNVFCLELGNPDARNKILWIANAHGEEMRGTEETLHVVRALLSDHFLVKTFLRDFHFTIIPTINPDAREYNLRWAQDEINLQEYFLTARRTIADANGIEADIEWGYPLSEDEDRIIRRPETAAVKELMDREKFDLCLDLHGALNAYDIGFWFLVGNGQRNREQTIDFLHAAGLHTGLPLIEREKMEGDLCLKLKPGVHTLCTAKEILKQMEKEPKLIEWFKKENGASSMDYLMLKNLESQCFVAELPTFYHEKYMDMTPSTKRRVDVNREELERSLKRCKEVGIPLIEEALQICQHPTLVKRRADIDDVSIPYINNTLSRLEEEYGDSMATMGEIRSLEEMSEYWGCPTYGRFGLAGTISRLPEEKKARLTHIYQVCIEKAAMCVKKVRMAGLRELAFSDSVNIQARTCLGLILIYFA